jgi:hypothetical protein
MLIVIWAKPNKRADKYQPVPADTLLDDPVLGSRFGLRIQGFAQNLEGSAAMQALMAEKVQRSRSTRRLAATP